MMLVWTGMNAQTLPYNDDFESYTVGTYIAVDNPTWWSTWSAAPGTGEDALVSNAFAHSPSKSICVDGSGSTATDLLLKLGEKTSGAYELTWFEYIETGKCGYYNIQHFESPGTEWALELYFLANGSGELYAGSSTATTFNYPKDTWFEVKHLIDLDKDSIQLFINGSLVKKWPFSWQASSTSGTKKLGCVDYFAGAKSGTSETPKAYVDDVHYVQTSASNDPVIGVTPPSITRYAPAGWSVTDDLAVSNTGLTALTYDVNIIYTVSKKKEMPVIADAVKPVHSMLLTNCSSDPNYHPTNTPPSDGSVYLNYDGDNASAIGWNSIPVTVTCAARYPNAMTLPYAGMSLDTIDVYINNLNTSGSNTMSIKIYGMGTSYEPGALLRNQAFTPTEASWNRVKLNIPLKITGEDIWVGYTFTQLDPSIYIPGTDAGPNDPNGDFLSTGVGWSHLSSNPALAYNWNIRAHLSGDPINHWLTASPLSGTVAPAGTQTVTVTMDATTLDAGNYSGKLRFLSNDPATPQLDVPVTIDVMTGIDNVNKITVSVYPNPAKDRINIRSNETIQQISIIDLNGKVVYSGNEKSINVSNLSNGVYFIKTVTLNGISNIKFVKE